MLTQADTERINGHIVRAEELYLQAIRIAGDAPEMRNLAASAWLKLGATRAVLAEISSSEEKAARIRAAIAAYHRVIDLDSHYSAHQDAVEAALRQELLARNNAAYLWQQTDEPQRFAEEFSGAPLRGPLCSQGVPALERFYKDTLPESLMDESFYYANHGDLMLRNSCPSGAFESYDRAIRLSPGNSRAVKGAEAALSKMSGEARVGRGLRLLDDLLLTSDVPVAYSVAIDLLRVQPATRQRQVLGALLRALAASTPTMEEFRAHIQPGLSTTVRPNLQQMANELIAIFDDPRDRLKLPLSETQAGKQLPHWTVIPELRQSLVLLLRNVADEYGHMGEIAASKDVGGDAAKELMRQALKRYAISWYLNPSDTGIALSMAAILRAGPGMEENRKLARALSRFYVTQGWREVPVKLATDEDPGRRYLELSSKDWNNVLQMYGYLKDSGNRHKQQRRMQKVKRMFEEVRFREDVPVISQSASPANGADDRSTQVDLAATTQDAALKVRMEQPASGDRFATGTVPDNTQRILLRVYADVADDEPTANYAQATLAFVDASQSRFFGTFQQPLRARQNVTCERVLLDGTVQSCGRHTVSYLHPGLSGLLDEYQVFFTAGTGIWHSPSQWGADAFYHLSWEFTAPSSPPQGSLLAESGSLLPRIGGHPHIYFKSFYDFRRDAVPGTVARSGLQDLTERRNFIGNAGYYAPVAWDEVYLNSSRYRYQPFAAPLAQVGVESIAGTSRTLTLDWAAGLRYGIMRSPLTLRSVNPQVWAFLDLIYGTGLTFRQAVGNPGLQLPRQMQIRGESGIPHTPIIAGFSKTIGQGPRNLQVYFGVRLDLLSLVNIFAPYERGF